MLITPQLRAAEAAAAAAPADEGPDEQDASGEDDAAPKQQVPQDGQEQLRKSAALEDAIAPAAVHTAEAVSGAKPGSAAAKLKHSVDERWPMDGTPNLRPPAQASMRGRRGACQAVWLQCAACGSLKQMWCVCCAGAGAGELRCEDKVRGRGHCDL